MTVLAHAGHWAAQLIYVAPVAAVAAMLAWSSFRDRRSGRDRDAEALEERSLDEVLEGRPGGSDHQRGT